MILGSARVRGNGAPFLAYDPAAREEIGPEFRDADLAQLETACALAEAAAPAFRAAGPERRATFLEAIAIRLEASRSAIVARAMAETGLPQIRLEGELGRTINQVLMFARVLRDGGYLDLRIDPALPERSPPRPDLRMSMVPVGPVAVFGASNFPLAFSVAGGDSASALAAGCPVVVKAHHAHPGTSELAARAIQQAAAETGMPEGTFSMLFGPGKQIGATLVADPRIQAVGFTGSRNGGMALVDVSRARRQPIPVYAEMSSLNPVVLLPGALDARAGGIASAFAGAVTLGAGQFCTNPGLLLAIDGAGLDAFIVAAREALGGLAGSTMLTAGIHSAFCSGVERLAANPRVQLLAQGQRVEGHTATPSLFGVGAADFLTDASLQEEVFGASSLLVTCRDEAELLGVLGSMEGQLTVAIHSDGQADADLATRLMPLAERLAGRVLFNGFGTGVEVCDAMVHGGPWPATSDVRTTSVGALAIARFLRPICYQDVPDALLPAELRDAGSASLPVRIDGNLVR